MSPQGDDRPPKRSGDSERPEKPGKEGPSKKPEYTIYGRSGREGQARGSKAHQEGAQGQRRREAAAKAGDREKPPYRVYRSRPSLRDRIRKPSLSSLRGGRGGGFRDRPLEDRGGKRPWLRWILIFAWWLLLSFITFAISAQIQKGKLPDSAKDALDGGPCPRPEHPDPRRRPPGQDAAERERGRGQGPPRQTRSWSSTPP